MSCTLLWCWFLLYKVVLTLKSVAEEILRCNHIQMKATEQFFHLVFHVSRHFAKIKFVVFTVSCFDRMLEKIGHSLITSRSEVKWRMGSKHSVHYQAVISSTAAHSGTSLSLPFDWQT